MQISSCEHGDIILGSKERAPDAAFDGGDVSTPRQPTAADSGAAMSGSEVPDGQPARDQPAATEVMDAGFTARLLAAKRASSGCGKTAGKIDTSLVVAGARAEFLLDLPSGYNGARAYPLVLAFRSTNVSAEQFRTELDLATVTAEDSIRVYANPVGDATVWEFQRDMPLVDALLAELTAAYCVDLDRVFALGEGAGALFVNLVGCVRADRVRGIALLSSAPPPPGPCAYNTAVWLLQRVDADPMIVNAGLGNRDFWAGRNRCQVNMSEPLTSAACADYVGCSPAFPVRYCQHEGDALPPFAVPAAWAFFAAL
jgi:poly(3-hydroxybutyrate) depolymerase